MNAAEPGRPARRGRGTLSGLFVIFALPIALAYALNVFVPGWLPFGRTNHGELMTPAIPIALAGASAGGNAVDLQGRWTLMVTALAGCGGECKAALGVTARIRRALGKDMPRVQRVLVVETATSGGAAAKPDEWDDALRVARLTGPARANPVFDGRLSVFVVDAQGYVVMRYPWPFEPKGLIKDLERLLRISKIG